MTEHLPIQEPDDYSPEDLMRMGEALFSALTSVEELERVCMTLAICRPRMPKACWPDSGTPPGAGRSVGSNAPSTHWDA